MSKQHRKRKLAVLLVILLGFTVVGASFWQYFASIEGNFTVEQAITIDNKTFEEPIIFNQHVIAGDRIKKSHVLEIRGNNTFNIDVNISGRPGVDVAFEIDGIGIIFPITLSTGVYNLDIIYNFQPKLKPGAYPVIIQFSA